MTAELRSISSAIEPKIYKGLDGVTVDATAISTVFDDSNSLTYRGYPVQDLSANCRFEEVAYLLLNGELPNVQQLSDFNQLERNSRELSSALIDVISKFRADAHPMDTLRTALSFLGQEDSEADDSNPSANLRKAIRMLAKIPTMIAAHNRFSKGLPLIHPDKNLGFSENFFNMVFGNVPNPQIIKAFDVSLTLYAEHSFNASTFTARVVGSTLSDIYSASVAAIGALKGPLHGGANEAVMHMLKEIDSPDRAKDWMLDAIRNKKKIMGFGHRVYKNGDTRVPTMTKAYHEVATLTEGKKWVEISQILEETMIAEKGIYPNLDFPAGPAYYLMGFDIPIFTPIFVMSRITGWAAHFIEQAQQNRLIRPLAHYAGVSERKVTPLSLR